MGRVTRRRLLQISGAATMAAQSGGMTALLAGRAPAYAQTTTLHWLRWADFVPASDQYMKSKLVEQCLGFCGAKQSQTEQA